MSSVASRILRLACALDQPGAAIDPRTNQAPAAIRGADLIVQLAAFVNGAIVGDVSNYDSLTLLVRALNADGTIGAVQFTKAIAGSALTACLQSAWDDGSGQHGAIALTGDDLNLGEDRYRLVVYGITSAGALVQWASCFFTISDLGLVDGSAPSPAGQYYTKTEADALFLKLAPVSGAYRIKTYADGSVFLQLKDSVTGKWRSMWLENGVEVFGAEEV